MSEYFSETHCRNGHLRTEENTSYYKNGTKRCLDCKREARRRVMADPRRAERLRESDRLWRRKARAQGLPDRRDVVAKYDDKKTAVHKVLAPRKEAMPTWERMWEYMEAHRTPCFERPEDFIDYNDPRYPEEATGRPLPSAFEARLLCAGCPLLEMCGEFAGRNKEDFGIWGGKRYVGGKVYNG